MKVKHRVCRNCASFFALRHFAWRLIICASLAQATEPEAKLVYADKPVDVFIDVINAENYVAANTAVARAGDLALSQKGLLFSLSRRAALNLTNQLHWFTLSNATIGSNVYNWRMEDTKERMSWLLCQVFGLDEGKYKRLQSDIGGEHRFMVLGEDCIDALDVLSKQKEEERVKSVIWRMKRMNLDALQALAENERSGKVLGILATNENVRIRLAVAKNGETPFSLLKSMRDDANYAVAEAAEKNLTYTRSFNFNSSKNTLSRFVQDVVFVQDVRQMDNIALRILKLPLNDREDLLQWLASRLCDLRSSPAPGEGTPPPGHDLSLIGGKCAYILEKALMTKLVPVRRDTPIETLNEQRERLMKRINNI